ncbi:MAG: hypothetical protein GX637_04410, partial [Clostridiales bacterium]|nr:hypothetical protein [Clostridiales bacterium]
MNMDAFIRALLEAAKGAGIEAAEVYLSSGDSFRAMCVQGEISNYTVNTSRGLSLRGLYQGKMGYAATEAFDEDAVEQMVQAVKESAELTEDEDIQEIYQGDPEYPEVNEYRPELDEVPEEKKLAFLLEAERLAKAADPRIEQLSYNMITTGSNEIRIANSFGLDLRHRDNMAAAFISATAREGDRVSTGSAFEAGRDFGKMNAEKLAREATEEALFMLKAAPVLSGTYRALIDAKCMPDLLGVFCGIFSAESAQKGMSLLAGK